MRDTTIDDPAYNEGYTTGYMEAMSTITEPGAASRQAAEKMQADHERYVAEAYLFIGGLLAGLAIALIIWGLATL